MGQGQERLFPRRANSRYYPLTQLRKELEGIVADLPRLSRGGGDLVLLDLGCGAMPYRPLFEPHVASYLGVDLAENEGADIHFNPDGRSAPLPDGAADVILSTQVLEHVEDPAFYLAECRRLLKGGGLLILSTHGYWPYHPSPNDYWRWTGAGLEKIVEQEGFGILRIIGIMGLAAAALQLLQDALIHRVPRRLHPAFSFTMQRLVAVFDALHTTRQKASDASIYLLAARKRKRDDG